MLNRIVLAIIFITSVVWISYVGLDILSDTNSYNPSIIFSELDEQIIIVNRPKEVSMSSINELRNSPDFEFIRSLNDTVYERGYFSAKQAQFLLSKSENWTAEDVKLLFNKSLNTLVPESGKFTHGEYYGRYYKKNLYVSTSNVKRSNKNRIQFSYDKKSSASIIDIQEGSKVNSITDIYFIEGGKVNYITHNEKIKQGKQVKDEIVFSGVVSKNFDSYHFFERDYYATLDSVYKSGPMSKWTLNGFLELESGGDMVIITDYIGGQDPILILNEINRTQDQVSFKNRLSNHFPSKGKSYSIKYLEDLVVISENEDLCDNIIADFKLGNTIALDKNLHYKIYGSLPSSVSERMVNNNLSYSKSVYRGKILESQIGTKPTTQSKKENGSQAYNLGFDIQDFETLSGSGNIAVLGKKGELAMIRKGKLQWSNSLGSSIKGEIQIIDLHDNGECFILLNSKDKIHLLNAEGQSVSGFPINLDSEASNEVKFYRWKGQSYFLIATTNNRILHYDSKGRELNIIKSDISINRKIDVWVSQKVLFAGFANDASFVMYDLDRNKKHREFPLNSKNYSVKIPNELVQYSIDNNVLVKTDQKGNRIKYQAYENGNILSLPSSSKNPLLVIKSANDLNLVNSDGISFGLITLPFNEVADIHVETSISGKTSVAIIDGLENNVYLYGINGKRILQTSLEGQTKVSVSSEVNGIIITTVVDQFIVQYFE